MIRILSAAALLVLAPATPAAAVIAIASSQAVPAGVTATPAAALTAAGGRGPAPTIDRGYGEVLAAGLGLAILMFALSINRSPHRVTA